MLLQMGKISYQHLSASISTIPNCHNRSADEHSKSARASLWVASSQRLGPKTARASRLRTSRAAGSDRGDLSSWSLVLGFVGGRGFPWIHQKWMVILPLLSHQRMFKARLDDGFNQPAVQISSCSTLLLSPCWWLMVSPPPGRGRWRLTLMVVLMRNDGQTWWLVVNSQ